MQPFRRGEIVVFRAAVRPDEIERQLRKSPFARQSFGGILSKEQRLELIRRSQDAANPGNRPLERSISRPQDLRRFPNQHTKIAIKARNHLRDALKSKGRHMNTTDLAGPIAEAHGISKAAAKQIVDGVFSTIIDAAAKGEEISIPGFGKFKVQSKPERQGRNPSNGETITIAASKKMAFSAAKALKDTLNPAPAPKKKAKK
jgi:DNA-binding protein HU-beta